VILPEYLFLYTRSDHYKTWVKNNIRAGAQPNINAQEYSSINILLPPIAEQKKISAILRTWDDAIEKLERLIILNDQKLDHLIQNLIFGIVRVEQSVTNERIKDKWISGPKDWSLIKIGDIASEKSKLNSDGKNHVVLSCSKHDGFVRSLEYFKKQIFSKDLKSYKIINRGDFGFPSNHVEEGSIGLQNLEDTAVVSPIYIIFTPDKKKIDSSFLYRLLKTRTYADIFRASTSSSVDRRGNLRWNEFAKILLFLPPLREQKQIATIIETQQVLIEKLKQHKELLISQKRGLMQKLLTGVWPVQADSSEESSNKKEKKHA
jgi:type I restriction enzyme S subunit